MLQTVGLLTQCLVDELVDVAVGLTAGSHSTDVGSDRIRARPVFAADRALGGQDRRPGRSVSRDGLAVFVSADQPHAMSGLLDDRALVTQCGPQRIRVVDDPGIGVDPGGASSLQFLPAHRRARVIVDRVVSAMRQATSNGSWADSSVEMISTEYGAVAPMPSRVRTKRSRSNAPSPQRRRCQRQSSM